MAAMRVSMSEAETEADGVNNAPKTRGRPFLPGNAGRPKGARNKSRVLLEALMAEDGEAIVRRVIQAAKGGDLVAARIVLDRIAPPPKDAPIECALPALTSAQDAPTFARAVLEAATSGELTPSEASALMGLLAGHARAAELADIEARLKVLENIRAKP